MSKRKLIENTELGHAIDLSQWSTVNIDKLSKQHQIVYENRKKAVEMYFADHSHFEIEDTTGLHRNEVARLVKRCLALDAQKVPWGYRALIPNKRIVYGKHHFKLLGTGKPSWNGLELRRIKGQYPLFHGCWYRIF